MKDALIIILIIVIPVVGFYFSLKYNKKVLSWITGILSLWVVGCGLGELSNWLKVMLHDVYIEKYSNLYHINENCSHIKNSDNIIKLKFFKIDGKGYRLCNECQEYIEGMNEYYESIELEQQNYY